MTCSNAKTCGCPGSGKILGGGADCPSGTHLIKNFPQNANIWKAECDDDDVSTSTAPVTIRIACVP